MPYKSIQQERWAHTAAGTQALGGESKVKEWDQASKGKKLPKKIIRRNKPQMTRTDVASPARMS